MGNQLASAAHQFSNPPSAVILETILDGGHLERKYSLLSTIMFMCMIDWITVDFIKAC